MNAYNLTDDVGGGGNVSDTLQTVAALQDENESLRERIRELEQQQEQQNDRTSAVDYSRFFMHGLDMLCVAGFDGYFKYLNPQWSHVLGYTDEELYAKPFIEFVHPDDRKNTLAEAEKISQGFRIISFENRYRRKDGTYVYLQWNATVPLDQQLIYATARNITERKHLEMDLERRVAERTTALRLTQFAVDKAGDTIFWLRDDGVIHYVNDTACQWLGYSRDEMLALNINDIDPSQTPDVWKQTWDVIKQQGTFTLETMNRRKDGSSFPVEATGTYFEFEGQKMICAFVRDITTRKQQEDELRLRQFALDNASDMVEWQDATGRLIYVNEAVCQSLGYTREELLEMTLPDLDPNFPPDQWQQMWNHVKQSGTITLESLHQRKDGSTFPVEVTTTYLQMDGQEFVLGFVRDITERKRQEAERAALQQQIIDAQRTAIRELSTPLIPITDSVMIMPLIGTIDSQRAQMVMESLLEGVDRHQADLVILDITGVSVVDTQVAQAFVQAAQAVRLLGAKVMLTGIQPQIAQTLVQLGADLSGIITRGSLQSGIAVALRKAV